MQNTEGPLFSRRDAGVRIAATTLTTVLATEALLSLDKSSETDPIVTNVKTPFSFELMPLNPRVLDLSIDEWREMGTGNFVFPDRSAGVERVISRVSRRGFFLPRSVDAQAGFVMANKLAWSYYDWQSIYPEYAASKGMVLPHGPDGPLERHDNAHEEKYGVRSHAQEEMAEWAASIERRFGFNPSYGFCHGLANAGILMPEPIRKDNPKYNMDYATCVRLWALKKSGMVHFQPHPYDHEANLQAHINYFFATQTPFVVNTPVAGLDLLYRVVLGISPDHMRFLVTNFGAGTLVVSRSAITSAYEPLTPEQAVSLGVEQHFIDAAKGRTLTELNEDLINTASYS